MELLSVDTIADARQKLLHSAQALKLSTRDVPLSEAAGCILARDVLADIDVPHFARSTMDGYAVAAQDTAAASESLPVFLTLAGEVEMGLPAPGSVSPGQCMYVPTGGMLPPGANAVVMVEYSEAFGPDGMALSQSVAPGENVVLPGEDMREGQAVLKRGTRLRPQEIGALAAIGAVRVPVHTPLRMALLSTGDELVPPDKAPGPGQMRDVNTPALSALAQKHGYAIACTGILRDDEALLEQAVRSAMENSDLVVVSGGSSAGRKDATAAVLHRAAKPGVFTHGLAIRPGKPTILGLDEQSRTLLVGLPGHPVSAMMVFELLLGWLAQQLTGAAAPLPIPAQLSQNLPSAAGRTTCVPVQLQQRENAPPAAVPVFGKSGMVTTLTQAGGYLLIDRDCEGLKKSASVNVHLF